MLVPEIQCGFDSRIMNTLFGNSAPPDDLSWVDLDKNNRPRYSTFEAARYLGISESTLRSWVSGRPFPKRSGGQGFSAALIQRPDGSENLSFVNLVETHILQCIKEKHEVSPVEVRKTIDYLSERLGSEHPLIENDFATQGKALFVKQIEGLLSATKWGQYGLLPILEAKLKDIEWRDGKLYRLFPMSAKTNRLIVMTPSLSSGRPVVAGSGVLAAVIWRRHAQGENIDILARDYRLGPEAIKAAIEFTKAA